MSVTCLCRIEKSFYLLDNHGIDVAESQVFSMIGIVNDPKPPEKIDGIYFLDLYEKFRVGQPSEKFIDKHFVMV